MRHVQLGAERRLKSVLADVGDDTHDREPLANVSGRLDAVANRALIGPEAARQRLVTSATGAPRSSSLASKPRPSSRRILIAAK